MRNIRGLDLNLLIAFDAIYRERSVTRAACRLSVTQSTMSGMLRRLRSALRDDLFVRTAHGLLPTPHADYVAGEVAVVIESVQSLLEPPCFEPSTAEIDFRLCGGDYAQLAILFPAIGRIRGASPGSRVAIVPKSSSNLESQLRDGKIDIFVCPRDVAPTNLVSRTLCRDKFICVGRRQHGQKGEFLSLEQLVGLDHLLVDPTGDSFAGVIDEVLIKSGTGRRVVATVPSYLSLFQLLFSDDYVAFVPTMIAANRSGDLKVFDTPLAPPELEIVMVWHERFTRDPRHEWLRSVLIEGIGQMLDTATARSFRIPAA